MSKVLLLILFLCLATIAFAQNNAPTFDSFIVDGNPIAPLDIITISEGETTNWLFSTTDSDADPITLSLYLLDTLTGATFPIDQIYPTSGLFVDSGNGVGTFDLTPLYYEEGSAGILARASDGTDSSEFIFYFEVDNTMVPPAWNAIADQSTTENVQLTFVVTATDLDNNPDGPPNHYPDARLGDGALEGMFLSEVGDGEFQFSWTPTFVQAGSYNIEFIALDDEDSASFQDTIIVHIDVTDAGNQPPTLGPIADSVRVIERMPIVDTITATDAEGGIITLTAENLPTGANFTPDVNNTAIFDWTPDETQYPIVYTIRFIATDDSLAADTAEHIIFVDGPNQPVTLVVRNESGQTITAASVTEGELLHVIPGAIDPDAVVIPSIRVENPPDGDVEYEDRGNGFADFWFTPSYLQAGIYTLRFIASDLVTEDTVDFVITVNEAGNQEPYFIPEDTSLVVKEGESLIYTVTTSDPDRLPGQALFITMLDTIPNFTFVQDTDTTGEFSMYPDLTQGGLREVRFEVSDSTDGAVSGTFALDTTTISIEVLQSNYPPVLDSIGGQVVDEGQYLRFDVIVSDADTVGPEPRLSVEIDPDSLDPSFYSFVDHGDSTGFFEMYADFSIVDTGDASRNLAFTFIAEDDVEADTEIVIVTVFNAYKDAIDPGEADTLIVDNVMWDGRSDGFAIKTSIWNDSALVAAGTGFSWGLPWLVCDSVVVHVPIRESGDYVGTDIVNDSSQLYVGFILFDYTYLDFGYHDYFTAYFSIDSSVANNPNIDLDTLWAPGDFTDFLKAQVGPTGGFAFDKRLRGPMSPKDIQNPFHLDVESDYVYVPFVNTGIVRGVFNMATISLYDVMDGITLRDGDTMYIDGTNRPYQLRIAVENPKTLSAMNLGFVISSPDGATWTYQPQTGGLGATTQAVTLLNSRMLPDTDIWDASSGLQVTEANADGIDSDSLVFSGTASSVDVAGLPADLTEDMIAVTFVPGGVGIGEVKTICVDTGLIDGMAGWGLSESSLMPTRTNSAFCYPVRVLNPTGADDDNQLPLTYSLSQNYPNPFNPTTTIRFSIAKRGQVTITVFNILGQVVRVLADDQFEAGEHSVVWDGRDSNGRPAASGIYLYRFESDELTKTRKMLLLK